MEFTFWSLSNWDVSSLKAGTISVWFTIMSPQLAQCPVQSTPLFLWAKPHLHCPRSPWFGWCRVHPWVQEWDVTNQWPTPWQYWLAEKGHMTQTWSMRYNLGTDRHNWGEGARERDRERHPHRKMPFGVIFYSSPGLYGTKGLASSL